MNSTPRPITEKACRRWVTLVLIGLALNITLSIASLARGSGPVQRLAKEVVALQVSVQRILNAMNRHGLLEDNP